MFAAQQHAASMIRPLPVSAFRSLQSSEAGLKMIERPARPRHTPMARLGEISSDRKIRALTARPLSEMLYHRSRERGLFLGFAAWNEAEIAAGARMLGRHLD
jgi:hypothetical protein